MDLHGFISANCLAVLIRVNPCLYIVVGKNLEPDSFPLGDASRHWSGLIDDEVLTHPDRVCYSVRG